MKSFYSWILATLISAAIGSVAVAICFGSISLWPSVVIFAIPVCMLSGLAMLSPWTRVLKKHGYRFAVLGGLLVGGLFGVVIFISSYIYSPPFSDAASLVTILLMWIAFGALFGCIYSVALKSVFVLKNRRK